MARYAVYISADERPEPRMRAIDGAGDVSLGIAVSGVPTGCWPAGVVANGTGVTMRFPTVGPPVPLDGVHATRTQRDATARIRNGRRAAGTEVNLQGDLRLRMITPCAGSSATICPVKIRAVTLGLDLPIPRV